MLNDSIRNYTNRVIERDYWLRAQVYLSRYLSDPVFHCNSFWDISSDYIQKVYNELQKIEKERLQAESITTAYLTDSILSIVHSLYGSDKSRYKSQPQVFLPGYVAEDDESSDESLVLDLDTLRICETELKIERIPMFAMAIVIQVIAETKNANQ
jgi:hypothetical protein